ncbi:hypothetical protein POM88_024431 [Heracleum sosnowskyi]|uniref:Nuclear transcription factor Y subunit n=1 Tax=Heracleum sosnowskyi TaxID=360622 RepID=A0AAD8MLY1_9APIA|nr:hypothetical protein POM88_024431 [Heracleum sosnowskyi]
MNPSMAHIPYAYGDPYVNGLYTAYGPQVAPQVIGVPPIRVPLPIELADEGPIYVNAKKYNGIMRRRQMCAKLEAQNKLLKTLFSRTGPVNQAETGKGEPSKGSSSSIMRVDNKNDSSYQHPNLMYISSNMGGGNGGFMYEGTPQRSSPVVR